MISSVGVKYLELLNDLQNVVGVNSIRDRMSLVRSNGFFSS